MTDSLTKTMKGKVERMEEFGTMIIEQVQAMENRIRAQDEQLKRYEDENTKLIQEVSMHRDGARELRQALRDCDAKITELTKTINDRRVRWKMLQVELQDFLNLPPFAYFFGYRTLKDLYERYFAETNGH